MHPMPPPPPPPPLASPGMVEDTSHLNQNTPILTITMNVITTVTHILLGAVAFSAFFFANIFVGTTSLTQHIHLCVFGYVLLMSQAILSLSPYNGWAHSLKYPNKKTIHWVMQIIGSVLAIAGSIVRFTGVNDHFKSGHGIFGFIAMVLTIVSLVGGVMNLIFPQQLSALLYRSLHICVGILTISFAFLSLCFGFDGLYRNLLGSTNANLSISLTVIALVGVLSSSAINLIKRWRICQ